MPAGAHCTPNSPSITSSSVLPEEPGASSSPREALEPELLPEGRLLELLLPAWPDEPLAAGPSGSSS